MERKKSTALGGKGLHHTEDPPTIDNRQLRPTTRKTQGRKHTGAKLQSKIPKSRSQGDGRDDRCTELNGDGDNEEENDDERDEGINETNDQIQSDGVEDVEDLRQDGDAESETESFLETYGTFRTEFNKSSRREAEKEFLRYKRELVELPKAHKQNVQQQKTQRFCTWALRQVKRRIKVLKGEEEARGEGSVSDGLSESDEDKRWKMYGIIAEDKSQYLIAWKGNDRNNGHDHDDEWTAKENFDGKDRREWEAYKRENLQ